MNWKIDIPADCIVTKKGYELNGRIYFRVTQVLGVIAKHGLAIWYRKVGAARAKQIVETRQALGTKVHKLFELILKGKTFDLDSYEYEIQEDVKMFHIFRKETKLEPDLEKRQS
jgi:(2Fe-2S) ferredoxin